MWLVRHLEVTRQLVLEDMRVVKVKWKSCWRGHSNDSYSRSCAVCVKPTSWSKLVSKMLFCFRAWPFCSTTSSQCSYVLQRQCYMMVYEDIFSARRRLHSSAICIAPVRYMHFTKAFLIVLLMLQFSKNYVFISTLSKFYVMYLTFHSSLFIR